MFTSVVDMVVVCVCISSGYGSSVSVYISSGYGSSVSVCISSGIRSLW